MEDTISRVVERGLRGELLTDLVDSWSFRIAEVSSNVYKMDGQELGGHHVINIGADLEAVVTKSIRDTRNFIENPTRVTPLRTMLGRWFRRSG